MSDHTTHALSLALGVLAKKHAVIASNIANAKVKSYKAQSINSDDALKSIFDDMKSNRLDFSSKVNKKLYALKTNTNHSVDLKQEIQEMSKTNIAYSRMLKAYSSINNLVDIVLTPVK